MGKKAIDKDYLLNQFENYEEDIISENYVDIPTMSTFVNSVETSLNKKLEGVTVNNNPVTINNKVANITIDEATTENAGLLSAADKTKLNNIDPSGATVSYTPEITEGTKIGTLTINGSPIEVYAPEDEDTTYENATTTTDGLMSSSDKTKLDGIASGAEVNVQSDWNQTTTTADDYIKNKPTLGTAAAKNVPSTGNAAATEVVLGSDSRLTDSRTPKAHTHTTSEITDFPELATVATSGKYSDLSGAPSIPAAVAVKGDAESSYRTGNVNITKANIGLGNVENKSSATIRGELTSTNVTTALGYTPMNNNLKGANNGVAELDSSGKVPSSQLPSYVDDVLEYTAKANFPTTGETGKIYVDTTTNLQYRWSGTAYVEISPSIALGETSSTAYRGDRGKAAYDHASAKGSAFSSGLYKITTNAEGHVTAATAVAKSDITALGIPASNTNTTYTLTQDSSDGHKFTFAGSDGTSVTITIPDNNTTYTLSSLGIGNVKNYDQSKAIKSITRSGTTFTYTCLDNTTGTFTQQDNNTWTAMVGATSSANGTAGYVPAPPKDGYNTKYLRADGTWVVPPNTDTHYASSTITGASATATANAAATNGNVYLNHIENGAVKSAHNIKGTGATTVTSDANGIITISSTNTTYTAATAAPGNVASASAQGSSTNYARQDHTHGIDLATGDANGQVKIAGTNVSVKGLGDGAYKNSGVYYGTCATAAATKDKVVSVSTDQNFTLKVGAVVHVKFTYSNSYSATADNKITLNVNSTGAKNIYYTTGYPTGTNATVFGAANYIMSYMYNGTDWVWVGFNGENNTTYSVMSTSEGTTGTATTGRTMSAANLKAIIDARGYTSNTGTVTSVATGVGLTGGTITGSGTIKAKLRSETALTNDSAAATETSGRVYPVAVDKSGYLSVNVPWTDNNTDTKNTAGSTDTSSKIFLIGATSQAANPQTYSHDTAYVGTDGCLYSGGSKVLTAHQDISGKADKSATVSTVAWDSTNKKLTKTINGTTSDVVTAAAILGNLTKDQVTTALGYTPPTSDTNTHRPIQMNGTEILGNNTTALNLKAGSNISLSNSSGTVTIAATDTNTWRGVQNNLTSTATDQSLSAAQGKILNEKITNWTTAQTLSEGTTSVTFTGLTSTYAYDLYSETADGTPVYVQSSQVSGTQITYTLTAITSAQAGSAGTGCKVKLKCLY